MIFTLGLWYAVTAINSVSGNTCVENVLLRNDSGELSLACTAWILGWYLCIEFRITWKRKDDCTGKQKFDKYSSIYNAQKMMFSIKELSSKCGQILYEKLFCAKLVIDNLGRTRKVWPFNDQCSHHMKTKLVCLVSIWWEHWLLKV